MPTYCITMPTYCITMPTYCITMTTYCITMPTYCITMTTYCITMPTYCQVLFCLKFLMIYDVSCFACFARYLYYKCVQHCVVWLRHMTLSLRYRCCLIRVPTQRRSLFRRVNAHQSVGSTEVNLPLLLGTSIS